MRRRLASLCLVLAFVGASCTFSDPSAEPAPEANEGPTSAPSPVPSASATPISGSDTFGNFGPPDFKSGAINASSTDNRIKVWARTDASARPEMKIKARNSSGQRVSFLALEAKRTKDGIPWVQIMVPLRPNGSSGWIRLDKGSIELSRVHERIEVDISEFSLKHYRNKELIHEFEIAVGESRYPTPTGTFFAWLTFEYANPQGAFGNYAIGLSGYSPVLSDWPGGGRAAIHGTTDPSDRGQAVSHGCVRVYNDEMRKLRKVPLGTPVLIHE